jgi:hypothetical protein
MKRLLFPAILLVLAACGGGRSTSAETMGTPVLSPTDVVTEFMQAVADSNLTRMGQLWGGAAGSAATTGTPPRWREQIVVMQLYLRGGTSRIIGNVASPAGPDRRDITIELERGGCTKQVPFTVHRMASEEWLIASVDINQAGNPARPCGVL